MHSNRENLIGKSVERVDALEKITGAAKYLVKPVKLCDVVIALHYRQPQRFAKPSGSN